MAKIKFALSFILACCTLAVLFVHMSWTDRQNASVSKRITLTTLAEKLEFLLTELPFSLRQNYIVINFHTNLLGTGIARVETVIHYRRD